MFNNQAMSLPAKGNVHLEEHCLNNERSEHKFLANLSPQSESRYLVKRTYTSPRILSKSVPRRNKNLIRYRINRSLSFDNAKNDCLFKSHSSSSGNSSFESDKQLTRSAKIMKALNFNCSPFYNQRKKIKKTLNFNLIPSPKKFSNHKSPRDNTSISLATSSPKINKTLNFDSSPSNSSTSSILLTSFESMDENQNQTPSQRNTKTKKLLNYVTPKKRMYDSSPDMDVSSPSLRRSLKEKIDDIVQMNKSTAARSFNRSSKLLNGSSRCNISTPRNLYADFSDEDNVRPCTPENTFSIVPESMSAIKKSHKKERSLRQIDSLSMKQASALTDPFMVEQFDDLEAEKRPLTPPMTEKSIVSVLDANSIKQSHKKDKSKKKIPMFHSEDEFSDSGSIFDYSVEQGNAKDVKSLSYSNASLDTSEDNVMLYETDSNNVSGHSTDFGEVTNSSNGIGDINSSCEEQTRNTVPQNLSPSLNDTNKDAPYRPETPTELETSSTPSVRVITPEHRIHFLQRIQTESIKKSHKKVKDEKKKRLFLPKSLDHKLQVEKLSINNDKYPEVLQDNENDSQIMSDENRTDIVTQSINRASTPENVNSSRLLLPNFSSVKKSHKKDKHNKIVSKFMQRQKYLKRDLDSNNLQHEMKKDSKRKTRQETMDESFKSNGGINDLSADDIVPHNKMSPSKRKLFPNLLDDDLLGDSTSMENDSESTEEFKIFTPIKRRKALVRTNLSSDRLLDLQSNKDDSIEEELMKIDASRCITPTVKRNVCESDNKFDLSENEKDDETKNNSMTGKQQFDTQNQNGRSTPTNMSTMELLPNINSIKRSHRKDKRGNGFYRGLILEQEKLLLEKSHHESSLPNDCSTSTIFSKLNENNSSLAGNNIVATNKLNSAIPEMQSSPIFIKKSVGNSNQNTAAEDRSMQTDETASSSKTPPNGLQMKHFIRLLQTTSIKKSHKKERDCKRHKLMSRSRNYDSELSDDGSIFGEDERTNSLENSDIQNSSNKSGTE